MKKITDLKDTVGIKTIYLLLFTTMTFGVYGVMWSYAVAIKFKDLVGYKVSPVLLIAIGFFVGMGAYADGGWDSNWDMVYSYGAMSEARFFMTGGGDRFFALIGWILYIVWAFKAKKALELYAKKEYDLDLKLNSFYTALLAYFYICYCINDLESVFYRHNFAQDDTPSTPSA